MQGSGHPAIHSTINSGLAILTETVKLTDPVPFRSHSHSLSLSPQSPPLTSGERCCGLPSRLSLLLSPSLAPSFSLLPLPESSTLCSSSDATSLPLRGSSPSTTMEEDITGAPLGLDEISGTPPAPTRGLETCSERREQILPLTS